jgi:hypothetical protein
MSQSQLRGSHTIKREHTQASLETLGTNLERPRKSQKKEKHWEQRIWHEIEKEDFTMNILAKSDYKPLTRNTNLGWQKAQPKSQLSPLTFSPQEHPKMKEHSHH